MVQALSSLFLVEVSGGFGFCVFLNFFGDKVDTLSYININSKGFFSVLGVDKFLFAILKSYKGLFSDC